MKRFSAIFFFFILAGCTSVSQTVLMPDLPQVMPEHVMIFLPGDSIPPHDRVAILAGTGNDNWSNRTQLMEHLRRRAGQLGANGVVIGHVEEASSGAKIVGYLSGFGSRRNQDAIAIRLHDYEVPVYSECDILDQQVMEAVEAYKSNPSGVNRQKMNDARKAYNDKCQQSVLNNGQSD